MEVFIVEQMLLSGVMMWKQFKHDMSDEKPRGDWMEFEYVMDLAPGTQNNYFKIDSCNYKYPFGT